MKKIKIILWVVIFALIGLIIFQNLDYFKMKSIFTIDLFVKNYQTPELSNAMIFLGCFLMGILIAYFSSLSGRFKTKKMIKNLNATIDAHLNTISKLKSELESNKNSSATIQMAAREGTENKSPDVKV